MKPVYFWSIIAVVAVFVIGSMVVRNKSVPAAPATSSVTSGVPATATDPAKIPVTKTPAAPATAAARINVNAVLLPAYYSQQIASTTLDIHVSSPSSNTTSVSPLVVTGEARGTWFFEASFPIVLTNLDGAVIASGHATANSNWMTTEFVPFSANLAFPKQKTGSKGYLVLKRDNPSGLVKNDAAVKMEVTF